MDFKIGVMVDSFRTDLVTGIRKAAQTGAQGIQIYATNGEMAPENLGTNRRKEILDIIHSNGLVVSALCGDMGGHGFAIKEDNALRIERSKRIMDLALDLGSRVVTTHIGVIPSDEHNPRYHVLREACDKLGRYADQVGAYFAIETGPEPARVLLDFLKNLSSNGVKVNLDPANFVMVTGDDPVEAVNTLGDYIVHTHAKDGKMIKRTDPEILYNVMAEGGIEDFRLDDYFVETPLGQGSVDFPAYLSALESVGYSGFLTIEREVGDHPESDIAAAVNFLDNLLK